MPGPGRGVAWQINGLRSLTLRRVANFMLGTVDEGVASCDGRWWLRPRGGSARLGLQRSSTRSRPSSACRPRQLPAHQSPESAGLLSRS